MMQFHDTCCAKGSLFCASLAFCAWVLWWYQGSWGVLLMETTWTIKSWGNWNILKACRSWERHGKTDNYFSATGSLPQNRIILPDQPWDHTILVGATSQHFSNVSQIGPTFATADIVVTQHGGAFFQSPANLTHLCVQQSNNKIYTKLDSPKVRVSIHCPQHTAGLEDQHWPVVDHPQLRGVSLGSPCFNSCDWDFYYSAELPQYLGWHYLAKIPYQHCFLRGRTGLFYPINASYSHSAFPTLIVGGP